jgi:flagellar biosynthesis protein FlhA
MTAAAAKPVKPLLTLAALRPFAVPMSVLAIILAMIVPMPPLLLDLLIAINMTVSVVVLMVAMYIRQPVDFSLFPTTLLIMTLFRLALNISSSRLILMNGNQGTAAAGGVIEAFGNFVVGGSFIIGVVIFLVLIAIQYVVINHGAVRISEVTARFTLDALPGKQMSIDSDLNAGLIDETQARERRKKLSAEAEFYGSMDGATRFTQRDAVASILITFINIAAGFLIGVFEHQMDLGRAFETYTVLTIGDGLVTVIPALMISIAGAMIVTRAASERELGAEFEHQLLGNPEPLLLASGVLLALAMFPGLPKIPFLAIGGGLGYWAWRMRRDLAAAELSTANGAASSAAAAAPAANKDSLEALLRVEPMAVEVGLGLVRLVEGGANSPLLRRIGGIRRQLAADLGYILPPVRVADNVNLRAREYLFLVKGVEVARFEIPPGCDLAIRTGHASGLAAPPDGAPTREPAFGMEAWWIPSERAEAARTAGFTVVDPASVLGTHLAETIRRYAHELFSRADCKKVLDRVAEDNPKAVEDLVPKLLPPATVQKVLQNLLRERVSIRDASSILEALGEAAPVSRNPALLTDYVRQAIRRTVVKPYLTPAQELAVWFLDAGLEQVIESAAVHGEQTSHLNLAPQQIRDLVDRVSRALPRANPGEPPAPLVLLVGSQIRSLLRQALESTLGQTAVVLSHGEVPAGVRVISMGVI